MTTLYLSSTAVPPVSPAFHVGWDRTTEGVRRMMYDYPDLSALADFHVWNGVASPSANGTALAVQFISEPMEAGIEITTSNTCEMYISCQESATNDNINRAPTVIKVFSRDGSTLRANIKTFGHSGANTNEWDATTPVGKEVIVDTTVYTTSYTTVSGDRLVVEVGGQVSGAGGTSVLGTLQIGATDEDVMNVNEPTATQGNPNFRTNVTLVFETKRPVPTPLALTLARFAPTVRINRTLTPTTKALTTTTFAPTVLAPRLATPATKTLTLTTYAPTVAINRTLTPDAAALTLTAFAPTVLAPRLVTPDTAALATESFTPAITVGTLVTVVSASLTTTAYAPTVRLPVVVIPGTLVLSLGLLVPLVGTIATPAPATLTIAAFAPSVRAPVLATTDTATLTLTAFDPVVAAGVRVVPGTASLTVSAYAPAVATPQTVTPATPALALVTYAPDVTTAAPPAEGGGSSGTVVPWRAKPKKPPVEDRTAARQRKREMALGFVLTLLREGA